VVHLAALVALLFGVGLALAALSVAVFRPLRSGPRAAAADFGSHRVILTTTVFATLLGATLGTILPLLIFRLTGQRSLQNVPGFLAAATSVSGVLLGVVYVRFIRPGVLSWASFGFGHNRLAPRFGNQVWLAHLVTGLAGWLLILLLSAAVQVVLRGAGVEQTQLREYTWVAMLPPDQFSLVFFAGACLSPFAEEIYFRGVVFQSYLRAKGPLVAYLGSAFVFALLHLNLPALPPILLLGIVLAWLYRVTGSLAPCVLAHGLNNGVAFIVLYVGSQGYGGG
jgi:membrane protease YdiL (CAAX protease family)